MMKKQANVFEKYNQLTLRLPGIAPEWATGSAPHAAFMTGAGLLAGRYLAPKLIKFMYPDADDEKAQQVGTYAGGLLGLGMAAPSLMASYSIGKDYSGTVGGGLRNLFGKGWPADREPMAKAAFWLDPVVQPGEMSDTLRQSLMSGQIDPTGALQMQNALRTQQSNTPAGFGASLVNNLITAGIGFVPAFVAGRIGAAALGSLGFVRPEAQYGVAVKTGLVGAAANLIGSML